MGKLNIAIDGPAGAGKSTVAKFLAEKLGIIYLDTGAMYRTVALKAIRSGVGTTDRIALAALMENINIDVKYVNGSQVIKLDGENVNDLIRTPEVTKGSSDVAQFPEVRIRMAGIQRKIAEQNSLIMDGRDIGSYVLPDADVKIFLTASEQERAYRRFKENISKGMTGTTFEEVLKDIQYRDKNDSNREFSPLIKADGAIEIDSTGREADWVIKTILNIIGDKGGD